MYPAVGELRGYPQRGPDARLPDARVPDARAVDARASEARLSGARPSDVGPAQPSYRQEGRMQDGRMQDARMQELGQRVQAFGAPASPGGNYRGAPLPVGHPVAGQPVSHPVAGSAGSPTGQSAPRQAGEAQRGYGSQGPDRGYAPSSYPEGGRADSGYPDSGYRGSGYPERGYAETGYAGYAYGIPPSAAEPTQAAGAASDAAQAGAASAATGAATGAGTGSGKGAETGQAAPERPQLPASTEGDGGALKGGFQRLAQAVRAAIPLVQKLLPLLDGNLATTVSALLAPQPAASHAQPMQVQVDLEPVERGLTELRASHRELKTQVAEQGTTLKRVEDQLERVREATDRNTLEQQELVEDVRAVGSRVSRFIAIGIVLLALSVGLNIYLLIQIQHIFR